MECKKWFKGLGPMIGMIMVQLISTGLQLLSKVIFNEGAFIFAIMTYRHLLAALCIAPLAFFLERDSWTKLSLVVGFWIFLSSLTGITMAMGMFYYGLRDTTATYATAFLNLIPIITFILSVIARMDWLKLNTKRGKIRVIGAILCVAGAFIFSLYKGKVFHIGNHHHHLHHHISIVGENIKTNWTRGTCLLVGSCLAYAIWFIVQVKLLKLFPSKYWTTMLICVAASVQTAVLGVCLDRTKSSWILGWNLQLVTIVYSGVLASATSFYLISWAVASKGPTFPSMFNPLSLIFVAIIETLFLGENFSIGSLLGVVVIIVGLYAYLWGTAKERKVDTSSLPKAASTGSEGGKAQGNDVTELQLTATVVPIASPISHVADDKEHK